MVLLPRLKLCAGPRNGEFIFRSSNSVKPATDLPEEMVKRVRAACAGYCLKKSPRPEAKRRHKIDHGDSLSRYK